MIVNLLFAFVLFPESRSGFFDFVQFIVVLGERFANFLILFLPLSSATFESSFTFKCTTQSHDINYIISQIWDHKEKLTFFMSCCLPTLLYHVFLGPERAKYNFLKDGYTTLPGLKVNKLSVFQGLSWYRKQVSTWLFYKRKLLGYFLFSYKLCVLSIGWHLKSPKSYWKQVTQSIVKIDCPDSLLCLSV